MIDFHVHYNKDYPIIDKACIFPFTDEIYEGDNPNFQDTAEWQEKRQRENEKNLGIEKNLTYGSCVVYNTHMKNILGKYIRAKREALRKNDSRYSLRQVATRIGVEPSYLSKIERGEQSYLSEEKLIALAKEIDEDSDVLLALSGKISSDIQEIIRKRPQLFAQLIRDLKNTPDHAVLRLVREVRDGKW